MTNDTVRPTTIEAVTGSMAKGYALLAGLQLDLFTALADGPLTVDALAQAVGGTPRRLRGLVEYLVVSDLLTVTDDCFANTAEADRYLVRGRPGSFVDRAGFWKELWGAYATTAASVQAGHALADHPYASLAAEDLAVLYRGYDAGTRARGTWLATTFAFGDCRTLVDVGGGSGGLAVALTERHPQIHATVADLPSVVPVREQFLSEAGATARVGTLGVDILTEPLAGAYDVAVVSNLLQVLEPPEAETAIRHVGRALGPGGTLYILGHMLDDTRLGRPRRSGSTSRRWASTSADKPTRIRSCGGGSRELASARLRSTGTRSQGARARWSPTCHRKRRACPLAPDAQAATDVVRILWQHTTLRPTLDVGAFSFKELEV